MSISVVIPARLGSTRLPRKVLLDIGGKPMLRHVWERASAMTLATEVCIATDSDEVAVAAQSWGAQVAMTSPDCASGTERIASLLATLKGDFILNVQGDEPFIPPALLDALVAAWQETGADIVTPVYRITDVQALADPNRVKVVRAGDGRALYFSRSTVPHIRGRPPEHWAESGLHWAHIGVYGYTRPVLEAHAQLSPSALEEAEKLEQLRFLDHGYRIQTVESAYHPLGVDTQEDLERARATIQNAGH